MNSLVEYFSQAKKNPLASISDTLLVYLKFGAP